MKRQLEIQLALLQSRMNGGCTEQEAREQTESMLKLHSDLTQRLEKLLPFDDQIRAAIFAFHYRSSENRTNQLFGGWLVTTACEIVYCAGDLSEDPDPNGLVLRLPKSRDLRMQYQLLDDSDRAQRPNTERLRITVKFDQQVHEFFAPEDSQPEAALMLLAVDEANRNGVDSA